MAGTPIKLGSILSFCVVYYAFYYRNNDLDTRLSPVRDHLLDLERDSGVGVGRFQPRVALGYGACHDLFVNATSLLNYKELKGEPEHFNEISTKDEFLKSFAYYFKHGAAAERFMSNSKLYDELVQLALKLPGSRWSIGGNAPLMAKRFFIEGWKVLLAAKMSSKLRAYIPNEIKVVGDDGTETVKDDVHMILEYRADEPWGPYKAPRANRFIMHNDENNPLVSSLENFGEHLPNFGPHLLVISGLQMMDNYPFKKGNLKGIREERIDLIKEQILSQPADTLVHFEMASYVELDLLLQLASKVIPNIDSIGMNEQELSNLFNIFEHGKVSILSDSNPRVATALDQMRKVFQLIRDKGQGKSKRKITRIHVHTLAYQAILTVKNSEWKRTKAATAKAALTAHRYVCNAQTISLDKSKLLLDDSFSTSADNSDGSRVFFEPTKPVACWDESLQGEQVEICVAPVLICTEAQLTAGAGDNISAAGLVLQVEAS